MARRTSPGSGAPSRSRLIEILTGDPARALAWARRSRALNETRKRKAREAEYERERKAERHRSGLRKRAADIVLDLIARIGRADWEVSSERLDRNKGRATGEGEPFEADGEVDSYTRYDRTVRAMTIGVRDAGRVTFREANVRVGHLVSRSDGSIDEHWETLVSLTADPHGLIGAFDQGWEDLPDKERRHGDPNYEGPVFAIQVYFVEHERK